MQKGTDLNIDSYSAFYDNGKLKSTGLTALLKKERIDEVVCVGLAFDYCVGFSALDAKEDGFSVSVVKDACRSIATTTEKEMIEKFQAKGIRLVQSQELILPREEDKKVHENKQKKY